LRDEFDKTDIPEKEIEEIEEGMKEMRKSLILSLKERRETL